MHETLPLPYPLRPRALRRSEQVLKPVLTVEERSLNSSRKSIRYVDEVVAYDTEDGVIRARPVREDRAVRGCESFLGDDGK